MKTRILLLTILAIVLASVNALAYDNPGDFDGPYSLHGVTPDVANYWATYVVGSSNQNPQDNILGEVDGSWAVGSPGGGWITVGFDQAITNGSGDDFAVWENGFWTDYIPGGTTNPHSGVYAEFGFVDVSTDGENWVTFPTYYGDNMTPFPNVDLTYVKNLAGNYVANYVNNEDKEGTPFDLYDILDTPEVLGGLVNPNEINYVRLRDIIGAGEGGSEYDSLGNLIYDGNGFGGGADWDAVGVMNAVPIPGAVWLFGSGLLGLIGIRRKRASSQ